MNRILENKNRYKQKKPLINPFDAKEVYNFNIFNPIINRLNDVYSNKGSTYDDTEIKNNIKVINTDINDIKNQITNLSDNYSYLHNKINIIDNNINAINQNITDINQNITDIQEELDNTGTSLTADESTITIEDKVIKNKIFIYGIDDQTNTLQIAPRTFFNFIAFYNRATVNNKTYDYQKLISPLGSVEGHTSINGDNRRSWSVQIMPLALDIITETLEIKENDVLYANEIDKRRESVVIAFSSGTEENKTSNYETKYILDKTAFRAIFGNETYRFDKTSFQKLQQILNNYTLTQ